MLPEWKFPCILQSSKLQLYGCEKEMGLSNMKVFHGKLLDAFSEFPYSLNKLSLGWDGIFIVNDSYLPHHLIKWGFIVVFLLGISILVVLSVLVGSSSPDEVSDFYFHDWAMLDLRNFLLKWYRCNKQSLSVFTPFTTFVGFVETKRKILSFPKCCHAIIRVVRTIFTFDCSFHLIFQFQAQYLHTVSDSWSHTAFCLALTTRQKASTFTLPCGPFPLILGSSQ